MKRVLFCSDSFKGTLSSKRLAELFLEEARSFPSIEVITRPLADGGEGTTMAFASYLGGELVSAEVHGPFGEKKEAVYLLQGDAAFLEVASVIGLPEAKRNDPSAASTEGIGELILHAVHRGAKTIYLGLGGSCSNDGGVGMASVLGTRFLEEGGKEFVPVGATLSNIDRIELVGPQGIRIIGLTDVKNPLLGPRGASYVYAPQKGADEAMVRFLEKGLAHLSDIVSEATGIDRSKEPGAGAAGGIGFGILSFLGGSLASGIEASLHAMGFDEIGKGADLIVTGEGKLDGTSFEGKAVSGVLQRAMSLNKPVALIVGVSEVKAIDFPYPIYESASKGESWSDIQKNAEAEFRLAARTLLRDFESGTI